MNIGRACVALAIGFAVSGCNEDLPQFPIVEGVQDIWMKMFAPYDVYPLLPIRTHVQPGDVGIICKKREIVFVSTPDGKTKKDSNANPVWQWERLFSLAGANKALADYASTRMAYHEFVGGAASDVIGPIASAPLSPYGDNASSRYIGFASFPSILSYSQSRSNFGVGAPVGTVAVGLGKASESQGFYVLEIPGSEYTELPFHYLRKVVDNNLKAPSGEIRDTLAVVAASIKDGDCLKDSLSVVSSAFATREVTVSVGASYADAISARLAYQLPEGSTRKAVFDALGDYVAGASAPAPASATGSPAMDQARMAKLIIDLDKVFSSADEASKLGFAGLRFGKSKGKGTGISMNYKYTVPLTFGLRLMPLSLDAANLTASIGLTGSNNAKPGTPPWVPYSEKFDNPVKVNP